MANHRSQTVKCPLAKVWLPSQTAPWTVGLTRATFDLCGINALSTVDLADDAMIAHQTKKDLICAYALMTSRKSRDILSSSLCNIDSLAENVVVPKVSKSAWETLWLHAEVA